MKYYQYAPCTSLHTLQVLEKQALTVFDGSPMATARYSRVNVGDRVHFTTKYLDVYGVVLGIDRGAVYPLKVQYSSKTGDSHIQVFTPNEFVTFQLLEKP